MKKAKSKNFIEPSDMFDELLRCLKEDQMSEALGEMIILFSTNLAKHRHFIRYSHLREDIIGTAVLGCMKSWNKFRPMRNNVLSRDEEGKVLESERVEWDNKIVTYDYTIHNSPFNFFTTCARNEILQFLKTYHYKQKNLINELLVEMGEDADYGYTDMMKAKEDREREDVYGEFEDDESVDDIVYLVKEIDKVKADYDGDIDNDSDDDYDIDIAEEDFSDVKKSFEKKSPFEW
jgi:hypothetical protein